MNPVSCLFMTVEKVMAKIVPTPRPKPPPPTPRYRSMLSVKKMVGEDDEYHNV